MSGLRILKFVLVLIIGTVGAIALFVAGFWGLAQFLRSREPDDEELRRELVQAAANSGLMLAIFHRNPAGAITFAEPYELSIENRFGFASIAPDGRHLFVYSGRIDISRIKEEGKTGIFRADGSVLFQLQPESRRVIRRNARQYLLSPDLMKLCVVSRESGVELISLTPHQIVRLSISDEKLRLAEAVSWDPSSSRIAFELNGAIYIYDLQKGTSARLVDGFDPAYAPTGAWIAFRSPVGDAMIVAPNGGPSQHLMKGVKVIHGFVWSPDAKYLAFTREYPLTFPFDAPAYLGIYRLNDGTRCIGTGHSFKGTPPTRSYGWVYAPELLKWR